MIPLREDSLHAETCKRTGLADFGSANYLRRLKVLLDSIKRSYDNMSMHGKLRARERIVEALINRLYLQRQDISRPQIADIEIERPIFILGLPRSGTTLLHNLMSLHPNLHAPRYWELRNPVTPEV